MCFASNKTTTTMALRKSCNLCTSAYFTHDHTSQKRMCDKLVYACVTAGQQASEQANKTISSAAVVPTEPHCAGPSCLAAVAIGNLCLFTIAVYTIRKLRCAIVYPSKMPYRPISAQSNYPAELRLLTEHLIPHSLRKHVHNTLKKICKQRY